MRDAICQTKSVPTTGDDYVGIKWMNVDGSLKLFANEAELVKIVVDKRNAHWE